MLIQYVCTRKHPCNHPVLYFIAIHFIKTKKQVLALNLSLLASGIFISIYAIAQFFGYDFIQWSDESVIKGRYFASMGNPNFLSALLIMIMPVVISFIVITVRAKKYNYSALLSVFFIMLYISLFGTQSRGPFLGFVISLLFMAGYGIKRLYAGLSGGPSSLRKAPCTATRPFTCRGGPGAF